MAAYKEEPVRRYNQASLLAGVAVVLIMMAGCDTGILASDHHDKPGKGGTSAVAALLSAALDPAANCALETAHTHDGVQYAGHYNNDGHAHNGECAADEACVQTNCAETGLHQHNGT
ncbi:MAG: hypothetical protein LBK61_10885, partial [Spirochaetaceae bacterium]|nr:hypothetical protein [Spirochaetaceae bacterium]